MPTKKSIYLLHKFTYVHVFEDHKVNFRTISQLHSTYNEDTINKNTTPYCILA